MRLLDRQRYGNFCKAYVICFTSLVGLYMIIDMFANVDEFREIADGWGDLGARIGRYYLVRTSLFFDRLCGVIAMMAAIFTGTWMQKNNELIALLAAGVSTSRAIRPVLIAAVAVSGLAVVNQEYILSVLGEELQRTADDDGKRKVLVYGRTDLNQVQVHGKAGFREARTIAPFHATIPVALAGRLVELEAAQARYVPSDDRASPLRGGWILHDVEVSPGDLTIEGKLAELLVELGPEARKRLPGPIDLATGAGPSDPARDRAAGTRRAFFLRTDVSFATVTRSRLWYQFAGTSELFSALLSPTTGRTERTEIAVFLHGRVLRPLLGLALLGVSLPLVLGGEGRNMFINLGLSLAVSAAYYALVFMTQYLGNNNALTPELSAWLPLMIFGTLAAASWGRIRT